MTWLKLIFCWYDILHSASNSYWNTFKCNPMRIWLNWHVLEISVGMIFYIQLQTVRDGPLDIWGGGWAIFLWTNFFSSPNCLQEFFFCNIPLHDIFLTWPKKFFSQIQSKTSSTGGGAGGRKHKFFFDCCKTPF